MGAVRPGELGIVKGDSQKGKISSDDIGKSARVFMFLTNGGGTGS